MLRIFWYTVYVKRPTSSVAHLLAIRGRRKKYSGGKIVKMPPKIIFRNIKKAYTTSCGATENPREQEYVHITYKLGRVRLQSTTLCH